MEENSSNTSVGSQTDESQVTSSSDESQVTSSSDESTTNSNGNFSGGFDSSALSNDSLNPNSTPDFGIDFGDSKDSNDNKSFGFGENLFSDFGFGSFSDSDSGSDEPAMTVDEVYGKSTETGVLGNQSIVENQGDYAATSNEKSNVETSTLGKQDDVSITPIEVAENKGTVKNDAVQSVEGLSFQQKDKESQDVLEAKKNRDEAETEDKANQMRDQLIANQESLKAKTDLTADEKKAISKFQIGNDDIDNIYKRVSEEKAKDLQSKSDTLTQKTNNLKDAASKLSAAEAKQAEILRAYKDNKDKAAEVKQAIIETENSLRTIRDSNPVVRAITERSDSFKALRDTVANTAKSYGIDIGDVSKMNSKELEECSYEVNQTILDHYNSRGKEISEQMQSATKSKEDAELAYDNALKEQKDAKGVYDRTLKEYDNISATEGTFRDAVNRVKESYEKGEMTAAEALNRLQDMTSMADYSSLGLKTADMVYLAGGLDGKYLAANPSALQGRYVGAEEKAKAKSPAVTTTPEPKTTTVVKEAVNAKPNAEDSFEAVKDKINNSNLPDETKAKAIELLEDVKSSSEAVKNAASELAANPNDPRAIETYINATNTYIERMNDASKGNPLVNTDLNRTFTEKIANANDFDVILPDGTVKSYAEFAAEMATRSPELAKGLYEARARKYEEKGHPFLAKLERKKADLVTTWFGSKLTLADNQIRNQFNQMAKTDMRATIATYDNVLNDKTGKYSEAEKAEASRSINQANALMTASTALKASTGFFSGIGDSTKDGVYGKTNPGDLNAYQKTLNTIDNFARITLGLGITPGAAEAYRNMYYMAGAKANEAGWYSKDFDGDGFVLCQEYGNNVAANMIAGAGELATGVAMFFNPAMSGIGFNLVIDAIRTFINGLYGVQKDTRKSQKYTQDVLGYFEDAKDIAEETGNEEAVDAISNGITQIENFELKADEVGNLDNWLEGSGSNTADNGKFNQALSYDEWLKLIEADPTMQKYAKNLIAEKKNK